LALFSRIAKKWLRRPQWTVIVTAWKTAECAVLGTPVMDIWGSSGTGLPVRGAASV
jgi:hypothetical protein